MRFHCAAVLALVIPVCICSCIRTGDTNGRATPEDHNGRVSDASRRYSLDALPTSTVTIAKHIFRVWVAAENDPEHPGVVQEGLMHVPSSELADDQGMLFVFPDEQLRGFWMKNTIAPLDIAFARMNGTIVKIWQMPPLTLQTFSSVEPAMFALEVKQGTFARLGIQEGQRLEIPPELLNLRW
jgi:uncharacterized membrane protein (UPF0127 family)